MIPTLHFIGSEKHKSLIKAICFDRFLLQYNNTSQTLHLQHKTLAHERLIVLLDACSLETAQLNTLIRDYTQLPQVRGIIISASTTCLQKLTNTKFSFKVLSLVDLEKFEPASIVSIINKVQEQERTYERMLAHHPILSPKIKQVEAMMPALPVGEISEMLALLKANNLSKYARQNGVSRSTVHRKLGKLFTKMNVKDLNGLREVAAKNEWI